MGTVRATTFDITGNREMLTNTVVDLSPKNAYLLRNLRRTRMTARRIDWQTDALATAAANGVAEGAAITFDAVVARSLRSNYAQLSEQSFSISTTQDAVATAGPARNETAYQAKKRMAELSRDMEFELVQGASATGTTAVARTLDSFGVITTTNISTATAARSWTRALHIALMETVFSNGGDPDLMYCKPSVLTDLADFPSASGGGSGSVVRTHSATGSLLADSFDIYRDPYGERKIVGNQFAISTATASPGLLFIDTGRCEIPFLQQVQMRETAFVNHARDHVIWAEYSLMWANELAHARANQIS